jgi:uridine kinase
MIRARSLDAAGFVLGVAVRLALILAVTPLIRIEWFAPFLSHVPAGGMDPWTSFLAAGGPNNAFPYGLPYVLALAPFVALGGAVAGMAGAYVALGLAVLACELALFALLRSIAGRVIAPRVTLTYWLSPVPIYVGYWHGQLDVLPVALLLAGLLSLKVARYRTSGAFLGAAVAAKLSMVLPLPFVGLYLFGRTRLRGLAPRVLMFGALAVGLLLLPMVASPGFREMVLMTPQSAKAFSLAIPVGPRLSLYILPLAYLALLYWAWQVRRLDFNLTWAFTGVSFMAVLLLTPASPGWVIWAMPFVALHVARAGAAGHVLYWPFALAFVALHLLASTGAVLPSGLSLDTDALASALGGDRIYSILTTLTLAGGGALAYQMLRRGVMLSAFQLATRKPFVIGISGDSSSGKDTLVDAVAGMFGPRNVARVSGDNYHVWDRHMPMWQAVTHLNPKANDLGAFGRHVAQLIEWKTVRTRHYDHAVGRMGEPVRLRPAEVVAISGLHALWSPSLRRSYDVRVFLDMDEPLRRFLKIRRDVGVRGHALERVIASMDRRAEDFERFIKPQARAADVVLRLEPRHPSAIADPTRDLDTTLLRLVVTLGPGRSFDAEARLLTSLCGMQVIEAPMADGRTEIIIEGQPTAEDIAAAARRLCPDMAEFLDLEPVWLADLTGIMQLVILWELDRSRRQRGASA